MSKRDPVSKLLLALIDDNEPYMPQYMRIRRNRDKVPKTLEEETQHLIKQLRDAVK